MPQDRGVVFGCCSVPLTLGLLNSKVSVNSRSRPHVWTIPAWFLAITLGDNSIRTSGGITYQHIEQEITNTEMGDRNLRSLRKDKYKSSVQQELHLQFMTSASKYQKWYD